MKRPKWTAKQRAEIFRDNQGECYLCCRKIGLGEAWEVEHPRARGLGGSDKQADMRPVHIDCHKPKTKRDKQIMAKADRQAKKHFLPRKESKLKSRGFGEWKSNAKQLDWGSEE